MNEASTHESGLRIVVVMPNWLGDGVMATPFLQALRQRNPGAHLAALALPLIAPVVQGLTCVDELQIYDRRHEAEAIRWLKAGRFEVGYLLPNSFRSAWMLRRGGVPQRLGYAREARGWLLTQRLRARKRSPEEFRIAQQRRRMQDQIAKDLRRVNDSVVTVCPQNRMYLPPLAQRCWPWRGYKPVPTIDYYLRLLDADWPGQATNAGTVATMRRMTLTVTPEERGQAAAVLASQGVDASATLVMLVPGANFGSSKCWPPERFAQVADRLMDRVGGEWGHGHQATVLLAGAPNEQPILQAIVAASQLKTLGRLIDLSALNDGRGVTLGCLKGLVERCRLMICNDTGPRHFACALGVPVVTLFGPTDPVWAETFYDRERQVRLEPPPPCGPCQLKRCPIDQRCLTGLTVDAVLAAAEEIWPGTDTDGAAERPEEPDVDPRLSAGSDEVA
jgi:heptosyltransferase-2